MPHLNSFMLQLSCSSCSYAAHSCMLPTLICRDNWKASYAAALKHQRKIIQGGKSSICCELENPQRKTSICRGLENPAGKSESVPMEDYRILLEDYRVENIHTENYLDGKIIMLEDSSKRNYLDGRLSRWKAYKWKICRWKIFNSLALMIVCMENILKLFNKHMEQIHTRNNSYGKMCKHGTNTQDNTEYCTQQHGTTWNNSNGTTVQLEYMLAVE